MKAKGMKVLCVFLGVGILFFVGCAAPKPAPPARRAFFGTTNVTCPPSKRKGKLYELKLWACYTELSDPLQNYMIEKERGGRWIQGIQGILFSCVPWSHETTFYIPAKVERSGWISPGKFAMYAGTETYRWTVTDAKESEVGMHHQKEPSFIVTIGFEPFRPEPPRIVRSRKGAGLRSRDCWWFPPPYLTPESLKILKEKETEKLSTPLGAIECYKLRWRRGKLSPRSFKGDILLSNKVEGFLWYDAKTGVLVKEDVKTKKGEVLKLTIKETNIEALAPKGEK